MNLAATVAMRAVGTAEGVKKEWDTRGRKGEQDDSPEYTNKCIGPECDHPEQPLKVLPHLDNIELELKSDTPGQNIHFDKEAIKTMLKMALAQLDIEDADATYLNTSVPGSDNTDHFVGVTFRRRGILGSAK